MPTVSVLLPAYDGGSSLGEAVESGLAQTYEDFELLVVDDCSRDGSPERVRAFGDPRIRLLVNETNLGQVPTLNRRSWRSGLGAFRATAAPLLRFGLVGASVKERAKVGAVGVFAPALPALRAPRRPRGPRPRLTTIVP